MRRLANKRERELLFSLFDGRCAICGEELDESFEIDHMVPFSQGGETTIWNMQPLHPGCHLEKTHAKDSDS
jgi:5-methylcytosine-specific restriction endonuclease McrA